MPPVSEISLFRATTTATDVDFETAEVPVQDGIHVCAMQPPVVQGVLADGAVIACVHLRFYHSMIPAHICFVVDMSQEKASEIMHIMLDISTKSVSLRNSGFSLHMFGFGKRLLKRQPCLHTTR